jgi:hypothetical protein
MPIFERGDMMKRRRGRLPRARTRRFMMDTAVRYEHFDGGHQLYKPHLQMASIGFGAEARPVRRAVRLVSRPLNVVSTIG